MIFGLIGPDLYGLIVIMALMGMFSGLLFVPLNALQQARSPDDGRGAVIAVSNALTCVGMIGGSALALGLGHAGIGPRETFLGLSLALMAGFIWALILVPDAFFRFLLDRAGAHDLPRPRDRPRAHPPARRGALLVPNHVSFADGLFLFAAVDRPIRFVVYSAFFEHPILGRFLRSMKAIPISPSGGPKMILQAFREAGRALDAGDVVCVFPEGQLTRTGMMAPFQRGLQRIVKGRTTPIDPDPPRPADGQYLRPGQPPTPPRTAPLPRDGLDRRADAAGLVAVRAAAGDQRVGPAGLVVPQAATDGPCITSSSAGPGGTPSGWPSPTSRRRESATSRHWSAPWPSPVRCGTRWRGQPAVGILLPTSVGGALVNLAASLAGRAAGQPEFHRPAGPGWSRPPRRPASVPSSPAGPSSKKAKLSAPRRASS